MNQHILKKLDPLPNCHLNERNDQSNVFIDDSCSLVAYLHRNQQRINVGLIDWEYKCIRLEKPRLTKQHYEKKKQVEDLKEGMKIEIQKKIDQEVQKKKNMDPMAKLRSSLQMEKSITCQIFWHFISSLYSIICLFFEILNLNLLVELL